MRISTNEGLILKKLKEVEKSAEDIIKEIKADIQQDPVKYIYSEIPDLPKTYRPKVKKISNPEWEPVNEPDKQALFAMEISVQKDMKTGESQVLSTATVTPEAFQEKGIKVYDDGRKSIFALRFDGEVTQNGVDQLTPTEVEELLRKATEKKSKTALEYHEPVFSSPYSRPSTPKKHDQQRVTPEPNGLQETNERYVPTKSELFYDDGAHFQEDMETWHHIPHRHATKSQPAGQPPITRNNQHAFTNGDETHLLQNSQMPIQIPYQDPKENHCAAVFVNSGVSSMQPSTAYAEDPKCDVLHAMPANIDGEEPVTMIFMGYQSVDDEEEEQQAMGFEGAIRAELVVIGDDDDNELQPSYHPDGYHSKVFQPTVNSTGYFLPGATANHSLSASKNSVSSQNQDPRLNHYPCDAFQDGQLSRDGTEDPSVTGIKKKKERCCSLM
ncbi:PALMD protein, partial [Amia calva]|nr:PALMD protein [Amia calva]